MASDPLSRMRSFHREVISRTASSQLILSKVPLPFAPVRFIGYRMRPGALTERS